MSEKSIRLSGVCLALFAARFARADDANRFGAILQPPQYVYDQQNPADCRKSKPLPATLRREVF
jgi:hypothetical protein